MNWVDTYSNDNGGDVKLENLNEKWVYCNAMVTALMDKNKDKIRLTPEKKEKN